MEVYARELARVLRELIGDQNVLEAEPQDRLAPALRRWRRVAGLGHYADRYWVYQRQVRRQQADVNHVVDHGYGHLAFSLDPKRTVVTFHDAMLLLIGSGEIRPPRSYAMTRLGHRYSLSAIRRVARVITDSESGRQDFLRFNNYDPERVVVVPLGVDPIFQPQSRRRGEGGRLQILHVGHCEFYKNIEGILRALPEIARRLPQPVVFVKIGSPFSPGQRQLIAELGIGDLVEHRGVISLPRLAAAYTEADLFLMPSLYEGFGLPALEAMACGTPVVAADRGSLREIVGPAGVLVEPTELPEIVRAVVGLLEDPARRMELSRRGVEHASQYTWEHTGERTLAVYESLLQGVC